MKKILTVILGILILTGGLIGCKPEEDLYEELYGTYTKVSIENGAIEVYKGNSWVELKSLSSNGLTQEVNEFIISLMTKLGDTITITKEKIKFSGGSFQKEFECSINGSFIEFDNNNSPISSVRYEKWISRTPPVYQLEVRAIYSGNEIDGVRIFYLKYKI